MPDIRCGGSGPQTRETTPCKDVFRGFLEIWDRKMNWNPVKLDGINKYAYGNDLRGARMETLALAERHL
jgi:hypothetical protein